MLGWTSPALPKLMADDSPIPITSAQGSTILAINTIGTALATIPVGWMMDRYLFGVVFKKLNQCHVCNL